MARAHHVKSSRIEHTCHAGHVIPAGEPYSWAAPGFRASRYGKKFACKAHPFKPSQLTTSRVSEALAAQEAFDDALNSIDQDAEGALDELRSAVEDFASELRTYADDRRASADAWEHGNYQLEEYADTAEAAADEAESFDVEDWGGDVEALAWDEANDPEPEVIEGDDASEEEHAEWESRRDDHEAAVEDYRQHIEQQFEAASEMSSGLEF